MTPIRQPRSVEAATALAERFVELEGQIEAIEAGRQDSIAQINARADTAANALIVERDKIREKLEPWWTKAGAELLATFSKGKRKTIELGGAIIGTRAGASSLALAGKPKEVASQLAKSAWGRRLLRITVAPDRAKIAVALNGKHADELKTMGLSIDEGEEQFVLKRAEQTGTLAGAE